MLSKLNTIAPTSSNGMKLPLWDLVETFDVSIADGLASLHDGIRVPFDEGIAAAA